MVDQQKFHGGFLRTDGDLRLGEDLHPLGNGRCAGRQRLGRLFNFNETHAAIRRDRQLVVITESRHVRVMGVRDVNDHRAFARFDRLAVNFNVDEIVLRIRCHLPARGLRRLLGSIDEATATVLDHVLEFMSELRDEALHRPCRRITQGTDRVTFDAIGDVDQ